MVNNLIFSRLHRLTALIFILIFTFSGVSQASSANTGDTEFLPVAEAFQFKHSQDGNQLTLSWEIEDGYYLYQSRLKVTQNGQTLPLTFKQAPISKEDEYFGIQNIFKHDLTVSTTLHDASDIKVSYQGCAEAGLCYPPVKAIVSPEVSTVRSSETTSKNALGSDTANNTTNENEIGAITKLLSEGSLIWKMAIFFALGLGLAFTPCVFPMVPILSSIIVGQGETLTTRRAFVLSLSYVLAMATTYAVAGVIVGYFGAQFNIQLYLQNPWVLSIFSLVFVALSLSMFGLYEIRLPRFLQDKLSNAQHQQQGGSVISVAIMGALSALVVSPCVSAPLAGTLVYISTTGDAVLGGIALLALGLGMGTPLLLIGTGGGKVLPKAGVWMNAIKNIFGVALLAVAIWIVERVIPAQLTVALWGVLMVGSAVYLGAFETQTSGWRQLQRVLGLVLFIYGTLLLIGASAGAHNPLAPLAGLQSASVAQPAAMPSTNTKITNPSELEKQIANAQPDQVVIVDFYADWCISCKVMDEKVFKHPQVVAEMANVKFLQLDITDNEPEQLAYLKKYGLFGPPAILFFKNNQELSQHRVLGDTDFSMFLTIVKGAKQS